MKFDDFVTSLDFIADRVLPLFGFPAGGGGHCSVQYVGGEVLTLPRGLLMDCVLHARTRLSRNFSVVRDGVQSNLIASEDKVLGLSTLFGERIGTSVDSYGSQRTVSGKAELYRAILAKNRAALRNRRNINPSAIFVVDAEGISRISDEAANANREGYGLVLRPVFQGGTPGVHAASVGQIEQAFSEAFDGWIMRSNVSIQPFYHLLARRLETADGISDQAGFEAGCPFQNDCAKVSLDLEPDGSLFTCLDMADSGQFCFGNALTGEFDTETWQKLAARRTHLDTRCKACPWRRECQGGCMSEAIHSSGSPYGRTDLCPVWESLFARIDAVIAANGAPAVREWMTGLAA